MAIEDAVSKFNQWHYPWEFSGFVKGLLSGNGEDIALFEAISNEVNRPEHWMQSDLIMGCKIAQNALKKAFPEIDDETLAAFVRSASYNWR